MKRAERLVRHLSEIEVQRFIVTNISSIRYLSGFAGSTAGMILGEGMSVLITDFRYKEQAQKEVEEGIEVRVDTRDVLTVICEMLDGYEGKVGFESAHLSYQSYSKIRDKVKGDLVGIEDAVERFRRVKDQTEIERIEKAVRIADEVFEDIIAELCAGTTEVEIAGRLDYMLRMKSGEVPAFDTIVACGEHASLPHARPGFRRIANGDMVKMDFGAIWEGYRSDLTRTVVVGKASEKVKEIYQIVLEANSVAIDGVRPGISAGEVDRLARSVIEKAGYGDNFGHSLGHGVGLDVHELPRLSSRNSQCLEPGNVVTIEPGIYIPGWGGVRIEDMVVVTENGCRVLTSAPKNLIEVK